MSEFDKLIYHHFEDIPDPECVSKSCDAFFERFSPADADMEFYEMYWDAVMPYAQWYFREGYKLAMNLWKECL